MDDLITAKRHMEHPHNIKAHGPQVACLGCAYACLFFFFFLLQRHILHWGGNNHNRNKHKTTATTNIYITFCTL